jgi:hypothetical protein
VSAVGATSVGRQACRTAADRRAGLDSGHPGAGGVAASGATGSEPGAAPAAVSLPKSPPSAKLIATRWDKVSARMCSDRCRRARLLLPLVRRALPRAPPRGVVLVQHGHRLGFFWPHAFPRPSPLRHVNEDVLRMLTRWASTTERAMRFRTTSRAWAFLTGSRGTMNTNVSSSAPSPRHPTSGHRPPDRGNLCSPWIRYGQQR